MAENALPVGNGVREKLGLLGRLGGIRFAVGVVDKNEIYLDPMCVPACKATGC